MAMQRVWVARCGGAGAALALGWLALWLAPRWALPLLGVLALARALASLCATWLAPALPRRLLPALGRRAVLVTGCDSGFGRLSALRLAGRGVRVVAGVLLPDGEGAQLLRQQAQAQALPLSVVALDVTDQGSLDAALRLVQHTLAEHSCELWAIVNNAGILKLGCSEWMNIACVQQAFDVNVLGQIRVTQVFLPLLRKSKGRVVNVVSLAGRIAFTCLTPYNISKFGSLGFNESLRQDLSPFSVSVHSIEPWIYHTDMLDNYSSMLDQEFQKIPGHLKEMYNNEFQDSFKNLIKNSVKLTTAGKSKLHQVIDAIEDACLAEDPMVRYVPGEMSKILDYFSSLIDFFQPYVLKLLLKKGNKYN